jgi:hypothetical protein
LNGAHALAIELAIISLAQSVFALLLDRFHIFDPVYRRILHEQTAQYAIDGVQEFFHDSNVGQERIGAVARMASLASRAASQLPALLVAAAGTVALFVALETHPLFWPALSLALTLVLLAAFVTLLIKSTTGSVSDFQIHRRHDGWLRGLITNLLAFETPVPYVTLIFMATVFATLAGVFVS